MTSLLSIASAAAAQTATGETKITVGGGDSISVRLYDAELRAAVLALARYVDRPVVIGPGVTGRVLVETPKPIARSEVLRLLRGIVEGQGMVFTSDTVANVYRVHPREPVAAAPQNGQPAGTRQLQGDALELFVIKLRHARAQEVAGTVNALYGRASALGELGARARGAGPTLSQQGGDPRASAVSAGAPPTGAAPVPQAGAPAARAAQFAGDVTIVPDVNSNLLLVRAGRSDYELVAAAVRQLDVRPLQALIEVIIAEVRSDRSFNFGVDARVTDGRDARTGPVVTAQQQGVGLGDFALRVMRIRSGTDLEATLRASAARGDARIVSRPIVLAANGETAEILVGSQRPFVQIQRSLPTDAPMRDQVVQYRDVGTRLGVRPTISSDGYISLAVTQEVNAATSETQFDAPIISTRTVQTNLLVRDSQVVVLGGLSDKQRDASQGGVPVLSRIPLLGGLFGRTSRRSTETEFFLFIRPRIIRTDDEADAVTRPFEDRARRAGETGIDSVRTKTPPPPR